MLDELLTVLAERAEERETQERRERLRGKLKGAMG